MSKLQNIAFTNTPPGLNQQASAAEKYARLREEIVAAGIPPLTDKELRQEIRERKGLQAEREA